MNTLSTWRSRRAALRQHRAYQRAIAHAPVAVQDELRAIADRG